MSLVRINQTLATPPLGGSPTCTDSRDISEVCIHPESQLFGVGSPPKSAIAGNSLSMEDGASSQERSAAVYDDGGEGGMTRTSPTVLHSSRFGRGRQTGAGYRAVSTHTTSTEETV